MPKGLTDSRSVLILDEVQTLLSHCWYSILDVLRTLVTRYATIVLCTATQPLGRPERVLRGLPPAREIVDDPESHFKALQRVECPAGGPWSWQDGPKRCAASSAP